MRVSFLFVTLLSFANAQRAWVSLGSKTLDRKSSKKSFFAAAQDVDVNLEEDESSFSEEEIIIEDEKDSFLQSCDIGFEGIELILEGKGKKPDRVILDGSLKGVAKSGRMLAVMGPSGSGKSSFIHALAGRIAENKKMSVAGKFRRRSPGLSMHIDIMHTRTLEIQTNISLTQANDTLTTS